jgi:predicted ATPase
MLQSLSVKNYRGFRDFKMDGFDRVNLITGANNVGKTSLLEALYLNLAPTSAEPSLRTELLRSFEQVKEYLDVEGSWGWLFYAKNYQDMIQINSLGAGQPEQRLTIAWASLMAAAGGHQPLEQKLLINLTLDQSERIVANSSIFMVESPSWEDKPGEITITNWSRDKSQQLAQTLLGVIWEPKILSPKESAKQFSRLDDLGRKNEVLEVLRILDERLKDLGVSVSDKLPMIYADVGIGRRLPVAQMGAGMVSLLAMTLEIINAPQGVVLIDEIESGLHHSVMVKVWQALATAARRYDVQIFATTHSLEAVRAAHIAFKQSSVYDLRLHRLEREGEHIYAVTSDEEMLDTAVELNWEVR